MFNKVLIANRGEISLRIQRTLSKLNIRSVAVYSDPDTLAQHALNATESYRLPGNLSSESYLNVGRIIEICKAAKVDAVHPGYGFLSENAGFAKALEKEGIVFVGPPESAMISMASKSQSKDIMLKAGVPCVPGWHPTASDGKEKQTLEFLQEKANEIGYPVLIKAVGGGGGKGMKIAESAEEFQRQLESAKRESMNSFGDDTVLLEKYLSKPRHVEVQIFSDKYNNHISLSTRDCSVQRRHQKILEEAPAPGLNSLLTDRLEEMARKAAEAVGYVGAGTVEFILDADRPENFYFMEMNTRLQVEHPVTEMITGVDLVQWQLDIAAGRTLPMTQDEVNARLNGHAFECRIYAENPRNNFLPDTGLLRYVKLPKESAQVRIETGFITGDSISVYYDPLISKLIVHAPTRPEALRLLNSALQEYQVVGPSTNIEFLKSVIQTSAFQEAQLDTSFIQKHHDELFKQPPVIEDKTVAVAALFLSQRDIERSKSGSNGPWSSDSLAGYRIGNLPYAHTHQFTEQSGENIAAHVSRANGHWDVKINDGLQSAISATVDGPSVSASFTSGKLDVDIVSRPLALGGSLSNAASADLGGERLIFFNNTEQKVGFLDQRTPGWEEERLGANNAVEGSAVAPMPSRIIKLFVKPGETVEAGAPLVMVEAMKTEHILRAPKMGVVSAIMAKEGDLVPEGKILVEFKQDEE